MDLEALENNYNILTVKEVSKILKIGKTNTYKLFASKTFPSYRIGNSYYIREEAFDNWLKKIDNKEILI